MKRYTCPRCGAVSYNLNDARERYCGRCHLFESDMEELDAIRERKQPRHDKPQHRRDDSELATERPDWE